MSQADEPIRARPIPNNHPAPVTGLGRAAWMIGMALGAVYLLNPTAGLFELIPDNIPIIGNLDEAAATTLLVIGLQQFGSGFFRKKGR